MPPTVAAIRVKSFDDPCPHGQTPLRRRISMESAATSPTLSTRCQDLQARVIDALVHSGYAALALVGCDVEPNRVILHGCVPSYHLKQLAQVYAQRVEGIGRIENRLDVRQL
jgi:osmotically-inducible protein OsmY